VFGKAPEFIIAGTGRSGTVYISWLLNELGIATRHEYFYGPDGYHKRIGVKGEVSWLAVPFLDTFDGKILHQTRHPIKTINSFVSVRAADKARMHNKYIRFIDRYFDLSDDPLDNAIRFYIEWNTRIKKYATYHFKIEGLEKAVPEICDVLGYGCPKNYKDILARSQKLNSKSTPQITYADLPKGPLLDALAEVAESYGYTLDE
ncbi:MAG: hypothetical protein ACPGRX_01665, partial [Bdellovibrionales bacterium]